MHKWILPTLSEVLALSDSTLACPSESTECTAAKTFQERVTMPVRSTKLNSLDRIKAEAEWEGAIAALEQLLLQSISLEIQDPDSGIAPEGIVFASPVPVLNHPSLSNLLTWIFTPDLPLQLPPATAISLSGGQTVTTTEISSINSVVPLLQGDPLSREQFCLVLTKKFSLAIVLGEDVNGLPALLFSFEPEVIEQAWHFLRARVVLTNPLFPVSQLDALVAQFQPVAPHYRTVTQFSRLLLKYLPKVEEAKSERLEDSPSVVTPHTSQRPDVELLQAFAHEVRTPLTTIRTLTRLLLKRCDLATDVIKRLKIIDRECSEQIDRMELLFRAAELETSTIKQTSAQLTAMSLAQVLQQSIPKWQQSAARRNLTLDVILPQQLPTVVSDPVMLDRVLTGLIENFTRSLSAGSHIQVQVVPAGDQLKLQLLTQPQLGENGTEELPSPRKSLGQLLMFHPETGNISLNFAATKHLFQAIGGKLIVRQRPQQGEVLTIFLPMDVSPTDFYHRGKGTVSQPV